MIATIKNVSILQYNYVFVYLFENNLSSSIYCKIEIIGSFFTDHRVSFATKEVVLWYFLGLTVKTKFKISYFLLVRGHNSYNINHLPCLC
jgi:hypothetical protein